MGKWEFSTLRREVEWDQGELCESASQLLDGLLFLTMVAWDWSLSVQEFWACMSVHFFEPQLAKS
jgi:hypothetical protein